MFIDEQGKVLTENKPVKTNDFVQEAKNTITGKDTFIIGGCSAGYDRKIHFDVGKLSPDVIAEDFVYSFRGLLSNGYVKVNEPLILYRKNDDSIMGKLKSGGISNDRLQSGELARLKEYKRTIDYYGNVNMYYRWRLNRRINLIQKRITSQKGNVEKMSFILWLLITGRYKAVFSEFKHLLKSEY